MTSKRVVLDEVTALPPIGTIFDPEEGKTRQELSDSTSIQKIVDRMMEGGLPEYRQGVYADVSDIKDLQSSIAQVRRAQASFNALRPDVRGAFDNDPAKFTDAFQTEEGIAKLRALRVLPPTEEAVLDAREAAAEERAGKRAAARERDRAIAKAVAEVDKPKA